MRQREFDTQREHGSITRIKGTIESISQPKESLVLKILDGADHVSREVEFPIEYLDAIGFDALRSIEGSKVTYCCADYHVREEEEGRIPDGHFRDYRLHIIDGKNEFLVGKTYSANRAIIDY